MRFSYFNLAAVVLLQFALMQCISPAAEASPAVSPVESSFICASDIAAARAPEIVDKAQAAYAALRSMKALFVQESYLAALDKSETSSGRVSFLKQGMMKWEYLVPEEQTFLVKGNTLWLYQPELQQVIIDRFENVLISDLPVSFLMGIGNLKSDFQVSEACRNQAGVLLELLPRAADRPESDQLRKFLLLVDPASWLPRGARVVDVGGNATSIALNDIEKDPASVKESDFQPSFPPGTDISDRRPTVTAE